MVNTHLSGLAVSVVDTGYFIGTIIIQSLFGGTVDMTMDGIIIKNVRIYAASDYHNDFLVVRVFSMIGILGTFSLHQTGGCNIQAQK